MQSRGEGLPAGWRPGVPEAGRREHVGLGAKFKFTHLRPRRRPPIAQEDSASACFVVLDWKDCEEIWMLS